MIKQIPSDKIKDFIKEKPKSILLDVRTKEEWDQIGKPDGDKIGIKTFFLSSQFQGRIINENFVKEFEDLKRKLLSKEQFDYTKERNVFNDIINKLSGFFKLRDYGDNDTPRSLITKAEISAVNGDLKSVLYYLEKLPDDWKVGLENFILPAPHFMNRGP